jgi:hypothetical protein
MTQSLRLIKKIGGVTALLFSTLIISNSSFALNTNIGNTASNSNASAGNVGQSFINDPLGTGVAINLNSWTFAFDLGTQGTAATSTLRILNGIGNGGSVVGTSTATSIGTLGGFPSVTWTFAGGLAITDTSTYTAVLVPVLTYRTSSASNPYPNGVLTIGTFQNTSADTVFQGTFSAVTPVPFEFNPALGLVGLGALSLGKKFLFKK